MKAKTIASLLVIFSLCNFNVSIAWHDGGEHGEQEHESNEGPDDGEIEGNETLEAKIFLAPTADAPEGAKGCAKLEAENEDGIQNTELEIKTKGLPEGDYLLTAVRKSDGSSVDLGTITLACKGDDDEDDDGDRHDGKLEEDRSRHDGSSRGDDDEDDEGENEDDDENGDHHGGDCSKLRSEVDLPADLDPMDISQIIVSDVTGLALLMGDFVNPANGTRIKFKAHVEIEPEEGAPECEGTAQVLCTANKGKKKNRFTMVASNVPSNSSFDVHVNGTHVGKAKSNKKGKVLVKKVPGNLLKLRSVELTDSEGHAVARAKF